jgi:hypothetical protein
MAKIAREHLNLRLGSDKALAVAINHGWQEYMAAVRPVWHQHFNVAVDSGEIKMTIQKLANVLRGIPSGAIQASMIDELFRLVVASWGEFSGSGDTSMGAWKILREEGPERVTWNPPCLSFVIDRHGGTVLGSTRAEKQEWTLNLEKRTANQAQIGYRQLRPNAKPLDVKPLADGVCKAVQEGPSSTSHLVSDGTIVWKNDDQLAVFHGQIVRGEYQQTVSGRRRRFIADLKTKMELIGWELVSKGRALRFKKTS